MKPVRLAWWIWAAVIVLALAAGALYAEPLFEARTNRGTALITIHSEPCALKEVVVNLPQRATWVEGGQVYEGCAGVRPDYGLVIVYFADKTVGLIPANVFAKVVTS